MLYTLFLCGGWQTNVDLYFLTATLIPQATEGERSCCPKCLNPARRPDLLRSGGRAVHFHRQTVRTIVSNKPCWRLHERSFAQQMYADTGGAHIRSCLLLLAFLLHAHILLLPQDSVYHTLWRFCWPVPKLL